MHRIGLKWKIEGRTIPKVDLTHIQKLHRQTRQQQIILHDRISDQIIYIYTFFILFFQFLYYTLFCNYAKLRLKLY